MSPETSRSRERGQDPHLPMPVFRMSANYWTAMVNWLVVVTPPN